MTKIRRQLFENLVQQFTGGSRLLVSILSWAKFGSSTSCNVRSDLQRYIQEAQGQRDVGEARSRCE